jgi:hypothetical protein
VITVLHVIGIDPGKTTGWCRLTVPFKSIYGNAQSEILEWDFGELHKDENAMVDELCLLARTTQSLAYLTGPGLVCEDWSIDPRFKSTDPESLSPVRIAAALGYAVYLGKAGDSKLVLQDRSLAKSTATDDRLRAWGLYEPGSDHIRDATRHAVTALRRAKAKPEFRDRLWVRQLGVPLDEDY